MTRPILSNCHSRPMDTTILDQVAQRYRNEGYEVTIQPRGDSLPAFLRGFLPDIIARRGEEGVVAEISQKRVDLSGDTQLTLMTELVNSQPGWRLDIIVLEHETMADRALLAGAQPREEQLGPMI